MSTADGERVLPIKNAMPESSYITCRICFDVDLSPNNIAVAMVYVVQGVLGLEK